MVSLFTRLFNREKPETGPLSIITNYDFKNKDDFDALVFVTWNEFLLAIIHDVINQEITENINQDEKIIDFLTKMFIPNENEAIENIHEFIKTNYVKLSKIKYDHYACNTFADKTLEKRYKFLYYNKIYYDFIKDKRNILVDNKSIINFYVICFFRLQVSDSSIALSDHNFKINYHPTNQLDERNYQKLLSDKVANESNIQYRLGLFISPVFDNGNYNEDNVKKIFEATKKVDLIIEKLDSLIKNDKIMSNVFFYNLIRSMVEPQYIESYFKINEHSHIYTSFEANFWVIRAFCVYLDLRKYFDVSIYCNPNDFKLNVLETYNTCKILSADGIIDDLEINKNIVHTVYGSSNFFIDDKFDSQFIDIQNVNNFFAKALLCYTILRISSEIFEFDTNEQKIEHFFNVIEIENKEPLNTNCIESNVDVTKALNIKILYACQLIYRELKLTLIKMGFNYSENVFHIYSFVHGVLKTLEKYELNDDTIIEEFYESFKNKNIKINLFNTEIKNSGINNNSYFDFLNNHAQNESYICVDGLKSDDIINQINYKEKIIKITKKNAVYDELECENNFAIYTILLEYGLREVLTSVTINKTSTESVSLLANICFKLNLKKNGNTDKNFLEVHDTNVIFNGYNSINFQTVFEQEYNNEKFNKLKPTLFYYNYYSYYRTVVTDTRRYYLDCNVQDMLLYILEFSKTFLKEERKMITRHVFVFNIVYVHNNLIQDMINTRNKSKYDLMLVQEYESIISFIKRKQIKLPECFIVTHDNLKITMESKTMNGEPLSYYYKPELDVIP
ncbi:hypothetical protein COBT_002704, partial [Conglomerata obtusa]